MGADATVNPRGRGILWSGLFGAPWKGASSQWVRSPPNTFHFRLVADGAVDGGS